MGKVLDLRTPAPKDRKRRRPRVDEPDEPRPKRRRGDYDPEHVAATFRAEIVERVARLTPKPLEWVQAQFQLYHEVQALETKIAGRKKLIAADTKRLSEKIVADGPVVQEASAEAEEASEEEQ